MRLSQIGRTQVAKGSIRGERAQARRCEMGECEKARSAGRADRFARGLPGEAKRGGELLGELVLAYGLDYALVLLLIAMWLFHTRSLTRE